MSDQKPPARDREESAERWSRRSLHVEEREPGTRRWLTDENRERARQAGYVVAVVVNAIMLAIAHALPAWGLPFITMAYVDVLWAVDLSLGATIIANALFVVYDPSWFRNLAQIILSALAVVSGYTMYRVFPFDFGSQSLNDLARLGLFVVVAILVLVTVAQLVKWLVDQTRDAWSA